MKSQLILRTPLAKAANRPAAIGAAVRRSGLEFEREVKENIQRSVPGGRTYKRTAITRKASRRTRGLRLARRGNNVVVGYNFHRASRRGQPPAILSGRLINSIRTRDGVPFQVLVSVGASYGLYLDDPQILDRPFFHSQAILYHPRFVHNVRVAIGLEPEQ